MPEEMESILGKLNLQISPAAQQLWSQASFPEAAFGCALLGGGLQDTWRWDWGRYPELMQVESAVSPMKYLLVLRCFFSGAKGGEGRERGNLRRSAGVMGARLE